MPWIIYMPPAWSCWTITGCLPEILFLSFLFVFWQIRCSEPFCATVVMAHDDGGLCCNVFWKVCIRDSEIDGDRTNDSIESFTRLWTNSWRRMKRSKFYQLFYIFVFGHERLGLVMVVICIGQYKAAHYQTVSTIHFWMIYQSCFNHSFFSRYNDSISRRQTKTSGYACLPSIPPPPHRIPPTTVMF